MSELSIKPGQIWRRKRDGSRLVVEEVNGTFDDVTYRRLYPSGERSRRQQIFSYNLRRFYEPVPADPTENEPEEGQQ